MVMLMLVCFHLCQLVYHQIIMIRIYPIFYPDVLEADPAPMGLIYFVGQASFSGIQVIELYGTIYRIIQIKMEIEHPERIGALQRAQAFQIAGMTVNGVVFQGQFTSPSFPQGYLKVMVTNEHLLMSLNSNHEELYYKVKFNFDLKFQILFSEPENPLSLKRGFKLYIDQQHWNQFFTENVADINILVRILSAQINERGFHYQYKPIKKLGKGNFASVYEVVRVADGMRFAVKAFSKINTFASPNGKQALVNELQVLKQLSHENILHLESVYESDNSIYVILDLLTGQTLYDVVKCKKGKFTNDEVKEIMWGLIKGLEEMGRKRILHRDLKPENIMFRTKDEFNPVIVDFGLSTLCDIQKYLFHRCGTPGFVAPEIIRSNENSKIQPTCDMFSIGCIYHILLSGNPIFPGVKYSEVYHKNKHLQFDMKTQKINEKDPCAMDLLLQMLRERPEERITPQKALEHKYFDGFRQEKEEIMKNDIEIKTNISRRSTAVSK